MFMLAHCHGLQAHLHGTQPALEILFHPMPFLLFQVKMSVLRGHNAIHNTNNTNS